MATIACPGCGLPRAKEQIGTTPCPVCDNAPAQVVECKPVARPSTPDPTSDLPADVSELDKRIAARRVSNSSIIWTGLIAFLLGTAVGVGGVLGWQSAFPPDSSGHDSLPELATNNPTPATILPPTTAVEMAPMPHLQRLSDSVPAFAPEPTPEPKKTPPALPPMRAIVIDLNQPDATYTVPFSMKKGEHVILRGKVKILRASGLDAGAILDASELEAGSVFIDGKLDGQSDLKLNAPNGVVTIAARVTGKSRVEINAIGGDVKFSLRTTPNLPGSQIDGGSSVTITARTVELRGDVDGVQTRVGMVLPPGGVLKVAAVRGMATVEYSVGQGAGNAPDVTVGSVAPTATFKKRN